MDSVVATNELRILSDQLQKVAASPRSRSNQKLYLCKNDATQIKEAKENNEIHKDGFRKLRLCTISALAEALLYDAVQNPKLPDDEFKHIAQNLSGSLKQLNNESFAKWEKYKTLRFILSIALCITLIGLPIFLAMRKKEEKYLRDHAHTETFASFLKLMGSKNYLIENRFELTEEEAAKMTLSFLRDPAPQAPGGIIKRGYHEAEDGAYVFCNGGHSHLEDGASFKQNGHTIRFSGDGNFLILSDQFIRDLNRLPFCRIQFQDNSSLLFKAFDYNAKMRPEAMIYFLKDIAMKLGNKNPNDLRNDPLFNNLTYLHHQGVLAKMAEHLMKIGNPAGSFEEVEIRVDDRNMHSKVTALFKIHSHEDPENEVFYIAGVLRRTIPLHILDKNNGGKEDTFEGGTYAVTFSPCFATKEQAATYS